ncbi:MAG: hypothetical protein MSJ26_00640 [Oscillospiraceae bacterium]|nr:hypothetical protein [Oscillospiraceae bacterium]
MKKNIIAAWLLSAMLLAACTAAPETEINDTFSETASESTSSENITEAVSEEAELTEDTASSAETSPAEEASEMTEAPIPTEDFDLTAYITEDFDPARPLSYEIIEMNDISVIDSESISIGAKAVKGSDFYAPIIEQAKELLVYENGTHIPTPDGEYHFMTEDYLRFFNGEGSSEFDFEPLPVYGANAAFDGANTGSLIVYQIPLSFDVLEWSGTATFYVSVYISSEGEASVLYNASNQTLGGAPLLIKYSDNKYHYCFQMGHTDSTSCFTIYSFEGEIPSSDINLYGCAALTSGDTLLRSENMAGWGYTFFRDGDRNSYCILKGANTSPELREYLKSVPVLAEKYPALKDDTDVDIRVYGGRFISINGEGFELEGDSITEYGRFIVPDEEITLPIINAFIANAKERV